MADHTIVPALSSPAARGSKVFRFPRMIVGCFVLISFAVVALAAPWLAPHHPLTFDLPNRMEGPSAGHPLGTDQFGRDILSRLIHGARVSLGVGLAAVLVAGLIGTTLGLIAGYFGGWTDWLVVALTDILLSFPALLVALAMIALLGSRLINVIAAIALAVWPGVTRIVRGEVLKVREREFIESARALGAGDVHVLWRHLLPNILAPLVVMLTFSTATAILAEASLGFLGLGVPPPAPTWGVVVSEGREYVRIAPWGIIFGGLAISVTVLALNLVGDALRDSLDPRVKAG